jgi:hypothetical protein
VPKADIRIAAKSCLFDHLVGAANPLKETNPWKLTELLRASRVASSPPRRRAA